jgi:excinuclease ABC subunit C
MHRTNSEDGDRLRSRVRAEAENRPGIYRFIGPRRELLYVGKSVRLRARLLSYFRTREGKALELVRVASSVEWEYVPNEFEAILREFRLIRAFRPRFNVQHRRHRRFAWVRITDEAAPRILATRTPRPDGSRYFGPFPATRTLPRTLRDLAAAVGVRDCPASTPMAFADQLDFLSLPRTPGCSRAELGSCPAPCAARCTRAEYLRGVDEAVAFLEGATDGPLDRLRDRMEGAARNCGFEVAARLRDREAGLRTLRDRVVGARRERAELSFVYRVPGTRAVATVGRGDQDPGEQERREEAGHPDPGSGVRIYLLREGRVRLTLDEPPLPRRQARIQAARALRAAASAAPPSRPLPPPPPAAAEPPSPTIVPEGEREELFLVAGWFRANPEERARGVPLDRYLSELTGV